MRTISFKQQIMLETPSWYIRGVDFTEVINDGETTVIHTDNEASIAVPTSFIVADYQDNQ